MEKLRGINLVGLTQALQKVFTESMESRKPVPWGIQAKEKDKLRKPNKASFAKKKRRHMVEASRRGNR